MDWKELFWDMFLRYRHWKLKLGTGAIIFFFFVLFLLFAPDLWPSRMVFASSYVIITLAVLFVIFYWKRRNVTPSPDIVVKKTDSKDDDNWIERQGSEEEDNWILYNGSDFEKSYRKRYLLAYSLMAIFALSFYGLYTIFDRFGIMEDLDPIIKFVLLVCIPLCLTVFVFLLFYKYYYKKKK